MTIEYTKEGIILVNSRKGRDIFIFGTTIKTQSYIIIFDHRLGEAHVLQMVECHANIPMYSFCKLFHRILPGEKTIY